MARRAAVAASIALVATLTLGCGYAPVMRERAESEKYCVQGAVSASADAQAQAALEGGVRQALARAGALGSCARARRLTVGLQSVASSPEAIVASSGRPEARAVRIVAVVWAQLEGQAPMQDEAEAILAVSGQPMAEAQSQGDARALAARRAGERLGRRLVGEPSQGP